MKQYRSIATILVVLVLAGLIPFAGRVRVDNRLERWISASADRAVFEQYTASFGTDEFVLVMYRGAPLFSEAGLETQMQVLERIEAIPGVGHVMSLPGVYRDLFGAEDRDDFVADVNATPFYKGLLVSEDGKDGAYIIQVNPPDDAAGRANVVSAVRDATALLEKGGYEVHFSGATPLNVVLDETSQTAAARTFPLAVMLSLVALAWLFRSFTATAASALCAGLAVAATVGFMGLLGHSLNMASSAMPAVLWVLSLSNLVQLVRRFQGFLSGGASRPEALAASLAITTRPTVLAAITNAAGFFSLIAATMPPIRELGAIAGFGLLLSLAINLTLLPWLLVHLPERARAPRRFQPAWPNALASIVTGRPAWIIGITFAFGGGLLLLLPFIRVESNPLRFLPADSETVRDYEAIGKSVAGYYSMEVLLTLPQAWTDPVTWPALEEAREQLAKQPGVTKVLSPTDILKKLRQWDSPPGMETYALPASGEDAVRLLDKLPLQLGGMMRSMVTPDGKTVRLTAFVNVMNSNDLLPITAAARAMVAHLPGGWSGAVTGIVVELVGSQLALVDAQIRSFLSAFVVIALIMAIGLRSWRMAAVAFPPNLLPILSAFGFMAVVRVPLDAATVTVAGVALGVAVDDTLHYLSNWRKLRDVPGSTPEGAAGQALRDTASGMATSSITACAGFLVMTGATFVPLVWFGVLCAVALAVGLVADLMFGPALALVADRKGWLT